MNWNAALMGLAYIILGVLALFLGVMIAVVSDLASSHEAWCDYVSNLRDRLDRLDQSRAKENK